jgi:hypothetical protein
VLCSGTPQPVAKQRAHVPEQGGPSLYFRSACSGTRPSWALARALKISCVYADAPAAPVECGLLLPSLLSHRRRHLGGGGRMEKVRANVVCPCTTAQTHTTPRRPAAPRRAPPEEATDRTSPASIFPTRRGSRGLLRRLEPVGGGWSKGKVRCMGCMS